MSTFLQFFDRVPCVAGAVGLGTLVGVPGTVRLASGSPSSVSIPCTREQYLASGARLGACAVLNDDRRGRSWWFVSGDSDSTDGGRVNLTLAPIRSAFTRLGHVREVRPGLPDLFAFTPGYQTVRAGLTQYVLSGRERDGFTWLLGVGEVAYTSTMDVGGSFTRWTYERYLNAVERATGQVLTLRPELGASSQLLGFWLDLAPARKASPILPLYTGPYVQKGKRTGSLDEAASVVIPVSEAGDAIGATVWSVRTVTASAPFWLTLEDPAGGDPPIAEDGQFVGNGLELTDGSVLPILASRASDSAVQVARSVAAGSLVALVRDESGAPLSEITSPAALATPVGRVVREARVARSRSESNRIANSDFRNGVTGWTHSSAFGRVVARARSDPRRLDGTVRIAAAAGVSTLDVTLPGGGRVHRGDVLQASAWEATTGAGVADAAGVVTVTVDPVVPAGGIADGTPLPIRFPDGTTRNTVASGAQAAGAGTVTLSGMPSIPALASGQTLTAIEDGTEAVQIVNAPSTGSGVVTIAVVPLRQSLTVGTTVVVSEVWRVFDAINLGTEITYVPRDEIVTTSGTVSSAYTAGAVPLTLDFGGQRFPPQPIGLPGAPTPLFMTGSFLVGAAATRVYTIAGPVAWNSTGVATVSINTPGVVTAIPAGTFLTWSAGPRVVTTAPAAPGALALSLRIVTDNALPAGGTIRLEQETLYVSSTLAIPSSGELAVPLHAPTGNALAAGRAVRIVRVRDLADDQPGSPTTLQLDALGVGAALQVQIRSTSVLFRVPPGQTVTLQGRAGVTSWAIRQANGLATWRIGVGAAAAAFNVALLQEADELDAVHSILSVQETLSATALRNLTISAEKGSGLSEFDFRVRWALLTASIDPNVPFTPASHFNTPFQAAQAVLSARSLPQRYTLEGIALREFLRQNGLEQIDPGQRVRFANADLGVDRVVDVVAVTYNFESDDESAELGILSPQLAQVTVS
jgi:hypothetical protein